MRRTCICVLCSVVIHSHTSRKLATAIYLGIIFCIPWNLHSITSPHYLFTWKMVCIFSFHPLLPLTFSIRRMLLLHALHMLKPLQKLPYLSSYIPQPLRISCFNRIVGDVFRMFCVRIFDLPAHHTKCMLLCQMELPSLLLSFVFLKPPIDYSLRDA